MTEQSTSAEPATATNFGKYENFADYQMALLRSIMEVTKAATALPAPGQDHNYYNSFPLFTKVMRTESESIMKLMSMVAENQIGKKNLFQVDGTDTEEKMDVLTEINDILLERAGIQVDIATGVKKESDIQLTTVTKQIDSIWNKKNEKLKRDSSNITLLTAANVSRPQLNFPDKIDNSNSPFVPIIKDKPNALKPLAILVETLDGEEVYTHPYEVEIDAFQPTEAQMKPDLSKQPLPLAETPLAIVETPEDLATAIEEIRKHNQVAIDLEHHSFRSFQGFTCLIQISTWEKDYIIDPLPLRGELHVLNEITTDPKVVKVLHGSHGDIQWLQRDFGVYIVNMFDTGVAAKLLNYQRLSLSYLLKKFVGVEADKRFQLVDWRIRPLPQEMIDYARTDTHYLLKISEHLKEELVNASNESGNLIKAAWQRSSLICLKRYEKPLLSDNSHKNVLKTENKKFNDKQLYALKHIFAWRDRFAREQDESTGYVLPNHMLLRICEVLPREMQGIISCCNPCPPLVKQQLNELHQIILKAREVEIINPHMDAPKIDVPVPSLHTVDFDNILNIVHDFPSGAQQDEAHLPTLLDDDGNLNADMQTSKPKHKYCFADSPNIGLASLDSLRVGLSSIKYFRSSDGTMLRMVTPYERYLKEMERAEQERASLKSLIDEAKKEAEEMNVEEAETSTKQEEEEEADEPEPEPEPEVIRGSSKKRKREDPSIPLVGGQDTSYAHTQTEKLAKRKQNKNAPKDFDYKKAIGEQEASREAAREAKRDTEQHRRGRGRGGFGRGRGGGNQKRRQFDDVADLQRNESSDIPRGAKKRRIRGNKSITVSGNGHSSKRR